LQGDYYWSALQAFPDDGDYQLVAVFGKDGSRVPRPMCVADRLQYLDREWILTGATVVTGDRMRHIARCRVRDLGLDIPSDAAGVASHLVSDAHRTSGELLSVRGWGVICQRTVFGLLPLLCLLFVLPGFLRIERRSALASLLLGSLAMALLPIGVYGLLARLLIANSSHVLYLALALVAVLLASGSYRWWVMRL
jgi:hypothetical protein